MKKVLLSFAALTAIATGAFAQTRLALYEEFSGENCGPCAAANPGLWTLVSSSANTAKMLLIKYQSPIPSAGPIYNLYPTDYQNRGPYYSVPFAPYGRFDGKVLGTGSNPGHVSYLTQTEINNEAAIASPFNITVTHAWNAAGDQVTSTIQVTCVSAFAPAGASLKLRVALLEHLVYATPPGTNGETDFHNVVRRMYPDGNGTAIANAWTVGQTQTYTITGAVPAYVDKAGADTRVVAWIQNDNDKVVAQAAVSNAVPLPLDVASSALNVPQSLNCTSGSANVTANVTIKNTGSTALTSAKIYYKVDAATTWQTQNWTGTLAAGATTNVALPAISLTPGSHIIYDSVGNPNNGADINPANNNGYKQTWVQNTTTNALPLSTGFENSGNMPTNYMLYDVNGNLMNWRIASSSSSAIGHNNSTYVIYHDNYTYPDAEANIAILPTPNMPSGAKALDFYEAYAQYQAENDKLEVVYSTNCGSSWTTLWSQAGTTLATAPATTSGFVPTQTQWKLKSVDMTSVPTGAMIGLRATSNYGNRLFVDDINLRTGAATGIEEVVASGYVQLYPNPASEKATLSFTMNQASNVNIQVLDATGRVVAEVANGNYATGVHKFDINTTNLAAGLYNVQIQTEKGNMVERLSVIK